MKKQVTKYISRPQSLSREELKKKLEEVEPEIRIVHFCYLCDYGTDMPYGQRLHSVGKNRICSCELRQDCPSIGHVKLHLAKGGERAPDPADDYWPYVPAFCPVCGAEARANPSLNFKESGLGWECTKNGTEHYWQARATVLCKLAQTARPADYTQGNTTIITGWYYNDAQPATPDTPSS